MKSMKSMKRFTWQFYEEMFKTFLNKGYEIITLEWYFTEKFNKYKKLVINRIDVDVKIERLKYIYQIFKKLKIRGSIFLRLHSPYYNLFSIGNILLVKRLIDLGCEIGIHTELEDIKGYCSVDAKKLLKKEIELFEIIFQTKIYGTASHGDMTFYNNLEFWKSYSPKEFDLLYEAYDERLLNNCLYITDSEWTQWKAYLKGELLEGDRRDPIEHLKDNPKVIYLLTHPDCWYENYIWE